MCAQLIHNQPFPKETGLSVMADSLEDRLRALDLRNVHCDKCHIPAPFGCVIPAS